MSKNLLTTQQAATELGVNDSRVRQLIRAGELKARQFGRAYLLEPSEVQKLVGKIGGGGKPGRPPKALGGPTTAKPAQTTAKLNRAFREAKEAEEAGQKKVAKKESKK
jgi:excisionase family DNA binding protein